MGINPVNVTSLSRDATERSERANPLDLAAVHALHADFVWASLQRLGVRDADLEDMHQEVFVVVHNKLARFDGHAKITTWLFAIALRVAASYRRRAHVRRERLDEVVPEDRDTAKDPENSASDSETRAQLMGILERMGLQRRAVFVMFEIEEMRCEEIARVLGVPLGTIYSRLHAARAEFEKHCGRIRAQEGLEK